MQHQRQLSTNRQDGQSLEQSGILRFRPQRPTNPFLLDFPHSLPVSPFAAAEPNSHALLLSPVASTSLPRTSRQTPPIMNRFALLTLLLLKTTVTTARTCYFPDGTEADSTYQPCNPDDDESACCALNKTNGAPNDICLDNGLCLSQDGQYSGIMFQNACTKESWGTDKCSHFCRVGGAFYTPP